MIEAPGPIVAGEVDRLPDPLDVDGCVLAVVLQQRYCDSGYGRGLHVRKRALQDGQTTDSDDGFDLAGLDERHDQSRAFGDEHSVAEALGFGLQILNGAETALLAEQPEFIERGWAAIFHTQALGKQQQASIVWHRGELLPADSRSK